MNTLYPVRFRGKQMWVTSKPADCACGCGQYQIECVRRYLVQKLGGGQ